jgi:hypothetical protein
MRERSRLRPQVARLAQTQIFAAIIPAGRNGSTARGPLADRTDVTNAGGSELASDSWQGHGSSRRRNGERAVPEPDRSEELLDHPFVASVNCVATFVAGSQTPADVNQRRFDVDPDATADHAANVAGTCSRR